MAIGAVAALAPPFHPPSAAPPANAGYDSTRDAAADIQAARAEAGRTGRLVLIQVGGDWCVWSRRMNGFFEANPDISALKDRGFVAVKVYFGPGNWNAQVLSGYPPVPGYPHLFVEDATGKLLESKDTEELEAGLSYDPGKFRAFLETWSPKD